MAHETTERLGAGDENPEDAYAALLQAAWSDLDGDGLRPLPWYLARFPGADAAIAAEWLAMRRQAGPDGEDEHAYVGRYRLLHEIGRGGQATVHLAEDAVLGRRVAPKVLEGVGPGAIAALRRFDKEARITSRMEHPAICPVYEVGTAPVPFIARRYVEGESLAVKIAPRTAAGTCPSCATPSSACAPASGLAPDSPHLFTPRPSDQPRPEPLRGAEAKSDRVSPGRPRSSSSFACTAVASPSSCSARRRRAEPWSWIELVLQTFAHSFPVRAYGLARESASRAPLDLGGPGPFRAPSDRRDTKAKGRAPVGQIRFGGAQL